MFLPLFIVLNNQIKRDKILWKKKDFMDYKNKQIIVSLAVVH